VYRKYGSNCLDECRIVDYAKKHHNHLFIEAFNLEQQLLYGEETIDEFSAYGPDKRGKYSMDLAQSIESEFNSNVDFLSSNFSELSSDCSVMEAMMDNSMIAVLHPIFATLTGNELWQQLMENLILTYTTINWNSYTNLIASGCKLIKSIMEYLQGGKPFLITSLIRKNIAAFLSEEGPPVASGGVKFEKEYKGFKRFLRFPLFKNLVKFLAYVISLPFCKYFRIALLENGFSDLVSYMTKQVKNENVFSMGELFFDSIFHFMNKLPKYCATGSWKVFDEKLFRFL